MSEETAQKLADQFKAMRQTSVAAMEAWKALQKVAEIFMIRAHGYDIDSREGIAVDCLIENCDKS